MAWAPRRSTSARLDLPRRALALAALLAAGCPAVGCTIQSGHDGPDAGPSEDGGLSSSLLFAIDPADPVLESVDGSTPSVTLRVTATSPGGEPVEVTPLRWTLDDDRLGTLDAHGTFTANGDAGGRVGVHAVVPTTPPRSVDATITVSLELTVPPDPSIPRDRIDALEGAPALEDPFGAATLLYPLEGATMPNNVRAPDLQWHPIGGEGDLFRVVIEGAYVRVRAYVQHGGASFRSRYAIDASTFRRLADSAAAAGADDAADGAGAEVSFRVDRLPAGGEGVITGAPVTITLSEDGLFGTLYYWQVRTQPPASDVFRLDAVSAERTPVFGDTSASCVGCHTVSHDGRYLAATRGGPSGWYSTVVDAASDPPAPALGPFTPAYHTLAWSPSAARILASRPLGTDRSDTRLFLLDGSDGSELEASGLPSGVAGQPTWSPDGALVAWMEGGGDGPDGTEAETQIVIADVIADVDGDAFDARVLHDGGDLPLAPEGGLTDSHPTFSPDSRFVAFAHGTRSISSGASTSERSRSALYLVPVEGGAPVRLDRGMGPEGPVDAFWPVFSPFVTEEADGTVLYWLAFYSRQGYGNDRAGTGGSHRRQLWLMAIDPALARQGVDPSRAPYWIPGQDTAAEDIAAHWAPTACLPRGEACNASSACCSGTCGDDGTSALRCLAPETCRRAGESCETAADCCDASQCNLNVCGYEPPT